MQDLKIHILSSEMTYKDKEKKECLCCSKIFRGYNNQIYCSKKCGYIFRKYGLIDNYPPYLKYKNSIKTINTN
jgi:hypothetical protein